MIGIFGGTFDPIHFGHLNLAICLAEAYQLEEVWFVPARYSPFKAEEESVSIGHRAKMVELAISDIPFFKVLALESQRPGPSYTVDTLRLIVTDDKENHQFRLLMGDDAMMSFFHWKEPEEIIKLAPPIIGCRSLHDRDLQGDDPVVHALKEGMTSIPIMEISSTTIREKIANHQYCNHLVPAKVMDYIIQNRLYSTP